jgi:hypothetical protein
MVTKKRLATIPDVESLKKPCQSLAMLDAIMSPEWEYRYYSFNSTWADGEMMASMRNGSGDEYYILFNSEGAIIKGFAHESSMSPWASESEEVWPGVLDQVPAEFAKFLTEPAFSLKDTTFCIWRRSEDSSWQAGEINYPDEDDPDGSENLLFILDGEPSTYQQFAEEYYEAPVDLRTVASIYEQQPLTSEMIERLNPEVSLETLKEDLEQICYPQRAI